MPISPYSSRQPEDLEIVYRLWRETVTPEQPREVI